MPPKRRKQTKANDPFHGDADKGWQYSDAKAALYAAITEGEIPLKPPEDDSDEDEDALWEFFCLRPEVHNYGGFDTHFCRRLNDLRKQIQSSMTRADEDELAF